MPRRTELDRPSARRALATNVTLIRRASIRYRAARRGTTTMMFAGSDLFASNSVLRNRLKDRTRASAFGCPNREENPAQSMTICSLGRAAAFIVIIVA